VKITMLVEGRTEQAFKPHLVAFLRSRLAGNMPRLDMFPYNGRIAMGDDLRRKVEILLSGRQPSDAVIGLTDVYTGTNDFESAADAKVKMRQWVNDNPAFHPHAAQYDFEAWLLPYWDDIQRIAGHNRRAPRGLPEAVNHDHPPSYYIKEIFEIGNRRDSYSKPRDANRILRNKDLAIAAAQCPELKSFLNTILTLCGGHALS
jgi:Domain of unknown function (DUF4276)